MEKSMADYIPYLGYELTGTRPVTELLEGHGIACTMFDDAVVDALFESRPGVLSRERDSVRIGRFAKGDRELFFAEIALQIHDGMVSHVSFLFDHRPVLEDLQGCADDMEEIVLKILKKLHDERGGLA